jgi:hypothetical protein
MIRWFISNAGRANHSVGCREEPLCILPRYSWHKQTGPPIISVFSAHETMWVHVYGITWSQELWISWCSRMQAFGGIGSHHFWSAIRGMYPTLQFCDAFMWDLLRFGEQALQICIARPAKLQPSHGHPTPELSARSRSFHVGVSVRIRGIRYPLVPSGNFDTVPHQTFI